IGQWKSVKIKKVKVNKDKAATEQGERIKTLTQLGHSSAPARGKWEPNVTTTELEFIIMQTVDTV
ncbi:hypothetical protein SARC_15258, partial [Sphaeroforma arctica JP610]